MKHISILVPKGAILGSLEGSRQLLTQVNGFFKARGEAPLFAVQLVGSPGKRLFAAAPSPFMRTWYWPRYKRPT